MTKMLLSKIFIIVIGGLTLMLFIYVLGRSMNFLRSCVQTKGKVKDIVISRSQNNLYTPVIEFTGPSKKHFSFSPNSSSTSPGYEIGEEVTVIYDPEFPEDAKIKSFFELWMVPIILFAVAGLFLALGIGMPLGQAVAVGGGTAAPVEKEMIGFYDKVFYFLVHYFLPGGFVLFGAVMIGVGASDLRKMIASKSWPTAAGKVMESEIKSAGKYYYPGIKYVFHVNKKKYESDNFNLTHVQSGDPLPSKRAVKRYPAGTAVKVYYNPKNPEECALEPGVDWSVLALMFGGAAGFLFAAWLVVMALRVGLLQT